MSEIRAKKYGDAFELEIFDAGICADRGWHWEIINRYIYISSWNKTDGYTSKAGAKRAALRTARRLGIELTND